MSSDEYDPWYYAVSSGYQLGVFTDLDDALESTSGYSYSRWKKFETFSEAEEFLHQDAVIVDRQGRNHNGETTWTAYDVMQTNTAPIVAFCDGSAIRNGQPDCTAAYACLFPHNQEWNEVKALDEDCRSTNNRAEYYAALAVLKRAAREDPYNSRPVVIFTDSELLVNTMENYIYNYLNNGWQTMNGTPVKNRDILEEMLRVSRGRTKMFRWVRAHTGRQDWEYEWNNKTDRSAQAAARDAYERWY